MSPLERWGFLIQYPLATGGIKYYQKPGGRERKENVVNVLIIYTDQQQRDTIGAYRQGLIRGVAPATPNLDKFAEGSVLFDNAICSQPVCSPSRASLMTGIYPHTHGVIMNATSVPFDHELTLADDIPVIGDRLKVEGYQCGHVGKWHVGREVVPQHGFDYWRSTEDEYTSSTDLSRLGNCSYFHYLIEKGYVPRTQRREHFVFSRSETAELPEEHSRIAFITEEAERFMEMNKDGDFCLAVNFLEPHPPYHGPYDDRYDPGEIELPVNFHCEPIPGMPDRARRFMEMSATIEQSCEELFDGEERWRDLIARYFGLVTLADKYTGRLLDKLAELGLEGNTMVVFTSDHGDMMSSHGMINKCVMYDEALRVPLIIRHPDLRGDGRHVREAANLVDVVPTILEGLDKPSDDRIQGESLLPLAVGDRAEDPEKATFAEWNGLLQNMHRRHDLFAPVKEHFIRTARTRDWKLNVNPGDVSELYDLANDPGEMTNLIDDARYRDVAERLLAQIRDWQERVADPLELSDTFLGEATA